jgi:hypothetical protein
MPVTRPATPGTADELRELIREAHGQNRDLRRAIKDGKAERDALENRLETYIHGEIAKQIAQLAADLSAMRAHVQAEIDRAVETMNRSALTITEAVHEAGGLKDSAEAREMISTSMQNSIRDMLPDIVESGLQTIFGAHGEAVVMRLKADPVLRSLGTFRGHDSGTSYST